jgi:hypothetical protein
LMVGITSLWEDLPTTYDYMKALPHLLQYL